MVCNHGGLSLDGVPAPISVLGEISDAVGARCEVLLAGGVRRGNAIAKSLCLGANATMIGRPFLYGLAAGGEAGVSRVIQILREEFDRALRLMGCSAPGELNRSNVRIHASRKAFAD
jgi:isopentenyl diphosphate isomerase/L-lactate dehydrogenase-like FMN-dependent dehydrogenase